MALFRAGHDDAFRAIHDRYRQRLFAYARQMLPARQDAEDALQDVFVRAYSGLRASQGRLVLRAWLYRVAHNRCIDELRRPSPPPPEVLELVRAPADDPIAAADQRESLRRLVIDVRRLPEQQRSALLMRELGGMTYADMADALGVSVPAVKSLLVRARIALAQALEARDTACCEIHEQLTVAHDRGVRPSGTARRHMRDCGHCRHFHHELRGLSKRFAALAPTVGPMGVIAKILGVGGGAGGSAATGGGAIAAGGAAGTGGAVTSVGLFATATGAGHIVTLIAAAAVTAGGAVEIQSSIAAPAHHVRRAHPAAIAPAPSPQPAPVAATSHAAAAAAAPARQVVIVPARQTSTLTVPVRHKQTRHHQRLAVGHIADPAAPTPANRPTGATDSSGTTSTTDGSATLDGSLNATPTTNGNSSTTTATSDPAATLDASNTTSNTTAPSTANGSPPTTSTSSPATTSSSVPTVVPATTGTTTSSSSPSVTSGSGNGA